MEEWILIRDLARRGLSLSAIAQETGRDRKTIRKVLTQASPQPRPSTWRPEATKLAPYREYLLQRVSEGCVNARVLLEEISRRGYAGKYTMLRDFLVPLRRTLVPPEPVVRFETAPGKQAQMDWGEFGRLWDPRSGRRRKLYGFVFLLGYSRAQWLSFTLSCDLEHFLHGHLDAFAALGIPQEILYDNLKTAILGRQPDGTPKFPARFLDFALAYGFTPKFCQPYRAQTKGKVERSIGYVRQNFWPRVASQVARGELDLAGLNQRADEWAAGVANQRVHGTTGVVVAQRFAEEQPLLGDSGTRPRYDTAYHQLRRVGKDGRLSYRGTLYQLAGAVALTTVEVVEQLDGRLTFRSLRGEALPATRLGPSTAGLPPASSEPAPGQGRGVLLLDRRAPEVEVRDLAVYEEVARAVATG